MVYATERDKVGRKPFLRVEADFRICANTYGVAPCTATGGTGNECRNGRAGCQDVPNFNGTATNTIVFTEEHIEIPGYEYLPLLRKTNLVAPKIYVDKGLGRRAQMMLTFRNAYTQNFVDDSPIDPYWANRSGTPQGTLLGKLKAIYKYYQGVEVRVKSGYIADPYDPADCVTRTYILDEITGPDMNGQMTWVCKDILALADDKRSKWPVATTGALSAGITSSSTASFTLTGGAGQYDASGYLRIGDEVIQYTSGSDSGADFVVAGTITRGAYNTTASSHSTGDTAQMCYELNSTNIVDFIDTLLFTAAGISSSYKDTTTWTTAKSIWFASTLLTGLLTEPTGVTELIEELQNHHAAFYIWWHDSAAKIKIKAVAPADPITTTFTDSENTLKIGEITEQPEKRITRVIVFYNPTNPIDVTDPKNYRSVTVKVDATAESTDEYGDERAYFAFARFFVSEGLALQYAGRKIARFRDPPKIIPVTVDAKETDNWLGDNVYLNSRRIEDEDGSNKVTGMVIVGARELTDQVSGSQFLFELLDAVYKGRYCRVSNSAYSSVYSSATDTERVLGGYIVSGTSFSDGEEGYKFP